MVSQSCSYSDDCQCSSNWGIEDRVSVQYKDKFSTIFSWLLVLGAIKAICLPKQTQTSKKKPATTPVYVSSFVYVLFKFNTLRLEQNGHHFVDDISSAFSCEKSCCIFYANLTEVGYLGVQSMIVQHWFKWQAIEPMMTKIYNVIWHY